MTLFGEQERNQIADAIAEVEQHTNAELVTVLAARSDDYRITRWRGRRDCALLLSAPLVFVHPNVLVVVCRFSSRSSARWFCCSEYRRSRDA